MDQITFSFVETAQTLMIKVLQEIKIRLLVGQMKNAATLSKRDCFYFRTEMLKLKISRTFDFKWPEANCLPVFKSLYLRVKVRQP